MAAALIINPQYQKEFRDIDVDGSGLITKPEFMKYYKTHKMFPRNKKSFVEWMYEVIDIDRNGKISFKEFAIFAEAKAQIDYNDEEWFERMIFRMMDVDKSGGIDPDEFKRLVELLGVPSTEKDIQQLIKDIDANKDGVINMDEFITFFKVEGKKKNKIKNKK